jgi:mRNA interferase RelE/StbE
VTRRASGRHPAAASVVVRLTQPAVGDLQSLLRRDPQIVRWALKKLLLLERDPEAGVPLHGALAGWRKIVVGDRGWRVVWRVTWDDEGGAIVDVAEVWAVGARADAEVYLEMRSRVAMLPKSPPTVALAQVVARLDRLRGTAPERGPMEVPPPWLVLRLTVQAGMSRSEVLAMSLEEAVDAWTAWTSRPHQTP